MTKPGKPESKMQSLTLPLGSGFRLPPFRTPAWRAVCMRIWWIRHFTSTAPALYQEKGEDYPDNHERFAAFSFAALELIKRSATPPDIIHCHDWQTALVPIYLRTLYRDDRVLPQHVSGFHHS